jgi:hypothetical protein
MVAARKECGTACCANSIRVHMRCLASEHAYEYSIGQVCGDEYERATAGASAKGHARRAQHIAAHATCTRRVC